MTPVDTDQAPNEDPVRPVIRTGQSGNLGLWGFLGVLLIGGFLIFNAMSARRAQVTAPTTALIAQPGARIAAPAPLTLPRAWDEPLAAPYPSPTPINAPAPEPIPAPRERIVTRVVEVPAPAAPVYAEIPPPPARPAVVFDKAAAPAALKKLDEIEEDRVLASRLANPSLTVLKGSVIPAVLETALDTTQPGYARALVQRDVLGFDGTRVLIARGSRVYGEYGSDINYGQNRALIRWTRLVRPDGVVVNLDSPSADPLGRAGIKGNVNTHFFARFGSAILQSVLDIGVGLATRSVSDDTLILALPGSRVPDIVPKEQTQVRPTLTIKQGTSVSVFVAKDLDFSSVDR